MLTRIVHRVVGNPWVYDQLQFLGGGSYIHRRLVARITPVNPSALVLDLGGGTGIARRLWPPTCTYVCLDLDPVKLCRFLNKRSDAIALLSDATCVPIRNRSVDIVLCTFVAHHLPDELLERLISESVRVLKSHGKFIFMDPVLNRSWVARLLWRFDRGSYPRSSDALHRALSARFENIHQEQFELLHRYLLWIGKP